jgi:hypothetical protein
MLYFRTFYNPNLPFQWCLLILWKSRQTELPTDYSPANDNLLHITPSQQNSLLMAGQLMAILPHYMMNVVDNANPLVADTVCKEEYKWVILWQYTFFSSYSTSEDWLF